MTTNLGKHCLARDFLVENLFVSNSATIPKMATLSHGSANHEHNLSSNGSVVYFKYAMILEVEKFITTNNSSSIRVIFKDTHHFDGSEAGVKIQFSGGSLTGNLRGLNQDEFTSTKQEFDTWDTNSMSAKNITFDVTTPATSHGDVTVSDGMVGTILIYKYLDLAGPSVAWQITYDQAPASLHS